MSMSNTEKMVKDVRRDTRHKLFAEGEVRIILNGDTARDANTGEITDEISRRGKL